MGYKDITVSVPSTNVPRNNFVLNECVNPRVEILEINVKFQREINKQILHKQ